MNMSRFIPLMLVALTLFCGCGKGVNYKISGRVPDGLDVKTIYLIDPLLNDETPLDSVTVGDDKTFKFSGTMSEPLIAMVVAKEDPRLQWLLIIEKGKITLNEMDGSVSGTELNNAIVEFNQAMNDTSMASPDNFPEKAAKMIEEFMAKHSNDLAGVRVLYSAIASGLINEDAFVKIYNSCGAVVQEHETIARAKLMIDARDAGNVGNQFVDVKGKIDGKEACLSDYAGRGNWVLVDFWASWCGPCRMEMPHIKEALAKFSDKGLQVVSIAVSDKPEKSLEAAAELEMTWPVMTDADDSDIASWGFTTIPQIYLIGPDGTIAAKELRGEELTKTLGNLIGRK